MEPIVSKSTPLIRHLRPEILLSERTGLHRGGLGGREKYKSFEPALSQKRRKKKKKKLPSGPGLVLDKKSVERKGGACIHTRFLSVAASVWWTISSFFPKPGSTWCGKYEFFGGMFEQVAPLGPLREKLPKYTG